MVDVLETIRKAGYWYIAVVIISVYFLTISLKFPTDVIDNMKLLKGSAIALAYGIVAWMTHNMYFMRWYKENPYSNEVLREEYNYFCVQLVWLLLFSFAFVVYVL